MDFRTNLSALLNAHCMENGSDTPDFILAQYLTNCLAAFNTATEQRERWYGRKDAPVPADAEPSEPRSDIVTAQHDETCMMWTGPRNQLPARFNIVPVSVVYEPYPGAFDATLGPSDFSAEKDQ